MDNPDFDSIRVTLAQAMQQQSLCVELPTDVSRQDIYISPNLEKKIGVIIKTLKDPEKFGTELRINGILLQGRSGTGKTMLARYIAGQIGAAFKSVISLQNPANVAELFEVVREEYQKTHKLQMLFFDEFQEYAKSDQLTTDSVRKATIAALKKEGDSGSRNEGLILVAATDRPMGSDNALRRRFEKKIRLYAPNQEGRLEMLKILAQGTHKDAIKGRTDSRKGHSFIFNDGVIADVSKVLHGYVGGDIRTLVSEAAQIADYSGRDSVLLEDFLEAKGDITVNALEDLRIIEPKLQLSDLAGLDSQTAMIKDLLERKKDGPVRILLVGKSGNGKDALAEAFASYLGFPYIAPAPGEFLKMWLGKTGELIQYHFEAAEDSAPCVLNFTEASGLLETTGPKGISYIDHWTGSWRTYMDRLKSRVIVFATTTNPNVFDKQTLRRFDRTIFVGPYVSSDIFAIFDIYLSKLVPTEWEEEKATIDEMDRLAAFSQYDGNLSGDEIRVISEEAAFAGARPSLKNLMGAARIVAEGAEKGDKYVHSTRLNNFFKDPDWYFKKWEAEKK